VAHITIDYPDEPVHWFAVYPQTERDRRAAGACSHRCEHAETAVIGWGPDAAHYELVVCQAWCGENCRGWLPAPGTAAQHAAVRWQHLEPAGAVV
jgi:hypothetical protein